MLGIAENLPFPNETFDFIVSNLSFHHFTDKERALDEVKRALRLNGLFKIATIAPHHSRGALIYEYFPRSERGNHKV